jgi:hypothetical protein
MPLSCLSLFIMSGLSSHHFVCLVLFNVNTLVCCGVLWCAVVCCGVLWCTVVCCAVVCCAVVWCAVVCCGVLCCDVV